MVTRRPHDPLCPTARFAMSQCWCDLIAKVRADERDGTIAALVPGLSAGARSIGDLLTREALADLRAKVDRLPVYLVDVRRDPKDAPRHAVTVHLGDVLALLDGGDP